MAALRDFEKRGGLIGAGDDAGFIYQMYGFGLIRELELHQEAGFQPLIVLEHATVNNAKILGQEGRLGRVRTGYLADLLVVNGNPLENLKVLYPDRRRRHSRRQNGPYRRRRMDYQRRHPLLRSGPDGRRQGNRRQSQGRVEIKP